MMLKNVKNTEEGEAVHAANSRKGITVSEYTHMNLYKARRVIE